MSQLNLKKPKEPTGWIISRTDDSFFQLLPDIPYDLPDNCYARLLLRRLKFIPEHNPLELETVRTKLPIRLTYVQNCIGASDRNHITKSYVDIAQSLSDLHRLQGRAATEMD